MDGKLFADVLVTSGEGDFGLVISPFIVTLSPAFQELVLLERLLPILPMLNKFLFAFGGVSGWFCELLSLISWDLFRFILILMRWPRFDCLVLGGVAGGGGNSHTSSLCKKANHIMQHTCIVHVLYMYKLHYAQKNKHIVHIHACTCMQHIHVCMSHTCTCLI